MDESKTKGSTLLKINLVSVIILAAMDTWFNNFQCRSRSNYIITYIHLLLHTHYTHWKCYFSLICNGRKFDWPTLCFNQLHLTMDMRLHSQTNTTSILPGRLWPLLTLSAHSWISQANEADKLKQIRICGNKNFSNIRTYFLAVESLSAEDVPRSGISSKLLKLLKPFKTAR